MEDISNPPVKSENVPEPSITLIVSSSDDEPQTGLSPNNNDDSVIILSPDKVVRDPRMNIDSNNVTGSSTNS